MENSELLSGKHFSICCKPGAQPTLLKHKGAILVLLWSFLGISVYHYYTLSTTGNPMQAKTRSPMDPGVIIAAGIFFPIGGWLADAYFGRYKVILCGMWTMWLGAMLNGVSLVISRVVVIYGAAGDLWVSLVSKIVMGAGFGVFQANIIQFGIDQLSEASSADIVSFIVWYALTMFTCGIVMQFSGNCTKPYNNIIVTLLVAVFVTLALCSNSLFSHWLTKQQLTTNPLPLIWKTVQYTVQNRSKWKRIFTLGHRGVLYRLNVAKTMYGGLFTSEQVEDVKTFFRVLAVIAIFSIACSGIPAVSSTIAVLEPNLREWPTKTDVMTCYKKLSITYAQYIVLVLAVLIYQGILRRTCHRCIPKVSITTNFLISVLFFLVCVIILLGMESASYYKQLDLNQTMNCDFQNKINFPGIEFYWITFPQIAIVFSCFLFLLSGIEFICAQAPLNMKGLLLGIGYALYGLGSLVQSAISIPFLHSRSVWDQAPLTCGIWYFIVQSVIVIAGFVVVIIVIKTYRRRIRIDMPQTVATQIESVNLYS
jgi:peptide/histidine transporter 3/4